MPKHLPADRHVYSNSETKVEHGDTTTIDFKYLGLDSVYLAGAEIAPDGVISMTGHTLYIYEGSASNVYNNAKDVSYGNGADKQLLIDKEQVVTTNPDLTTIDTDNHFALSTGSMWYDPNMTAGSHNVGIDVKSVIDQQIAPGWYQQTATVEMNLSVGDHRLSNGETYSGTGRHYFVSTSNVEYVGTYKGDDSRNNYSSSHQTASLSFSDSNREDHEKYGWTAAYHSGGVNYENWTNQWSERHAENHERGWDNGHSVSINTSSSKTIADGDSSLSSGHYYAATFVDSSGRYIFSDGAGGYLNHNTVLTIQNWTSAHNSDGSSTYGALTIQFQIHDFAERGSGYIEHGTTMTIIAEQHDHDSAGVPTTDYRVIDTMEIDPKTIGSFLTPSFFQELKDVEAPLQKFTGASVKGAGGELKGALDSLHPNIDLADFNFARSMTNGAIGDLRSVPSGAMSHFDFAEHQLDKLFVPSPVGGAIAIAHTATISDTALAVAHI